MTVQTYANHAHQPRPTLIGFLFVLVALVSLSLRWFGIGDRYTMAAGLLGLIAAVVVLLLISRAYITALQDRIIKLEMKVRCATLLTPQQRTAYDRLTKQQIIALRFASDGELPALVERADRDKLTADQVKQAITNWTADHDRT